MKNDDCYRFHLYYYVYKTNPRDLTINAKAEKTIKITKLH